VRLSALPPFSTPLSRGKEEGPYSSSRLLVLLLPQPQKRERNLRIQPSQGSRPRVLRPSSSEGRVPPGDLPQKNSTVLFSLIFEIPCYPCLPLKEGSFSYASEQNRKKEMDRGEEPKEQTTLFLPALSSLPLKMKREAQKTGRAIFSTSLPTVAGGL